MPNPEKNHPDTDKKKSRGLGSYVIWAFVVVVLYFLSTGPISLMDKYGMLSPQSWGALEMVYSPISYLFEHTPLRRPMGMYMHLWRPEIFDKWGEAVVKSNT
jgi:hypothetical protein